MRPAPRPIRPPTTLLSIAAGIATISGVALFAGAPSTASDSGLSPRTIARHLANTAPADAREVRVSGVYGSGHRGTWQFTGFVTWLDPAGTIQGGGTELPQNGGQPTIDLGFPAEQLATEHRIGWTTRQVEQAMSGFHDLDAGLAMVEIAITVEATTVIGCAAASTDVTATCASFDPRGRVVDRFTDRLLDTGLDAAGVQRESAPITPPIEG
jgi:hypothetical protein